ncbi:TPA: hypothetical protein ACGE88_004151 [Klebsiella pneumoniae]
MVEIIQRHSLSAPAGAGSSILSADIVACLFIAVLNQIHLMMSHFAEKKFLHKKSEKLRITQLSARFSGTWDAFWKAL